MTVGSYPQREPPKPWIKTPLVHSTILSRHAGCQIYLKLENLQPSGSFKLRGIGNLVRSSFLPSSFQRLGLESHKPRHFYSSSGGNAGLACVHAATALGAPATIVVPFATSEFMKEKIWASGAREVIQHGKSWMEADRFLREEVIPAAKSRGEDAVYVPPFDAREVWDGNSGIVHEVFEQLEEREGKACADGGILEVGGAEPAAIICSVGGGGLLSGVMQGLENVGREDVRVVAMETAGADSFARAREAGRPITLEAITSIATTLGARQVCQRAFDLGQRETVKSVVLSDQEAVKGCVRFAADERMMVEPACGVCLAMCYDGRLKQVLPDLKPDDKVVIVVCGGSNVSVELLDAWTSSL